MDDPLRPRNGHRARSLEDNQDGQRAHPALSARLFPTLQHQIRRQARPLRDREEDARIRPNRLPLPLHGRRAPFSNLRSLFRALRGAQILVLLHPDHARGFCVCVRLPDDGALAVHQLPPQERGAHAGAHDDV